MRLLGRARPQFICVDLLTFTSDRENLNLVPYVIEDAIGLEDELTRVIGIHVTSRLAAERERHELLVDMIKDPLDPLARSSWTVVSDVGRDLDHAIGGAR